jgi:transposase, IS30 family
VTLAASSSGRGRGCIHDYFATPSHSWERGSNENFNGLLHQYLPRGMGMRNVSQSQSDQIADDLNTRPRKRHSFQTPAQLYHRY